MCVILVIFGIIMLLRQSAIREMKQRGKGYRRRDLSENVYGRKYKNPYKANIR